jgi:hypothetical protein
MSQSTLGDKRKLIIAVSLLLCVGFALTTLINYYVSKSAIRESIVSSELPLTSDNIYSEIQSIIQEKVTGIEIARHIGKEYINAEWGPAIIKCFPNGVIREKQYYVNNKLHDYKGQPAKTWYYETGSVKEEFYFNRKDNLAQVAYHEDGTILRESYGSIKIQWGHPELVVDRKPELGPATTLYFPGPGKKIQSTIYKQQGLFVFVSESTPSVEVFYPNGQVARRAWGSGVSSNKIKNGPETLHRISGPAYQEFGIDGKVLVEAWFRNGIPHREGGPSLQKFDEAGTLITEEWRQEGSFHRETDDPAFTETNNFGQTKKIYYVNGNTHRPHANGPAVQVFRKGGKIKIEQYVNNAVLTRPHNEGPAYIEYDDSGKITEAKYKLNGEFHRPASAGPAHIVDQANGKKVERFYEFGLKVPKPAQT